MGLLKRIYDFFNPTLDAEKVIKDFVRLFPGRCPVCAFRRHAMRSGVNLPRSPHNCPEEPHAAPAP